MFESFAEIKGVGVPNFPVHLIYRHMVCGQQKICRVHSALGDILDNGKYGVTFKDTADIVLGMADL